MEPAEPASSYDPKIIEPKWQKYWEEKKIYAFDPDSEKEIYAVDTPPPTVSGNMHIGHAFSYSQQDIIVRYQRMLQKNVFFPFGTDDNGLATERLIERLKKVKNTKMKRQDFIELCLSTLEEIRPDFVADWKRLGVSCDFGIFYSTINDHCRRISQRSFIELYKQGREYRKEAPTLWCPECHMALAQVELEDKEFDSVFSDIVFKVDDKDLVIATTRPELLPACVAVFFHPSDPRYPSYEGKKARVPLFNQEVPILADERVSTDKGTGIVMCCTFGDQTDMEWYFAHNLPLHIALNRDGTLNERASAYAGLKIKEARTKILEDLKKQGLVRSQKAIRHMVNVHERCGTEIEILHTKQWFINYLDMKKELIDAGRQMVWHPPHMRVRYENWITGLQWDWCISRQRYFGVPIPAWYCSACDYEVLADEKNLPVDPMDAKPPLSSCPKCGNTMFVPEKDVLDTWATSSLSPLLAIELFKNHKVYKKLFPMDLRPQAHDIITFWLFNTVVKSLLHKKTIPWKNIAISGFALDPHGKKMSKSKGNVVDPRIMINKFSTDALRFWAAGSKLGEDLPFMEKDLVTAKKMMTKLWNAARFSHMHLTDINPGKKTKQEDYELFDRWVLAKLQQLVSECTEAMDSFNYARAKQLAEIFFWQAFCDYYLEIVKDRLYNPDVRGKCARESAQHALYQVLLTVIKLFAPIIPFITEELYQTYFAAHEKAKSIHISPWPAVRKELADGKIATAGDNLIVLIGFVRKYKSDKQLSLKADLQEIIVSCDAPLRKLIEEAREDILATTRAKKLSFSSADGEGEACSDALRVQIVE